MKQTRRVRTRSLRNFLAGGGLVLLVIAGVILGAFPPSPTPHPVEKVLPNEKFAGR